MASTPRTASSSTLILALLLGVVIAGGAWYASSGSNDGSPDDEPTKQATNESGSPVAARGVPSSDGKSTPDGRDHPGDNAEAAQPTQSDPAASATADTGLQARPTIRGHVLNRITGAPIDKAEVEVYLVPVATPSSRAGELGERIDSGETDAKGAFELSPPRAGTLRLRVRAEDFTPHVVPALTVQAGQDLAGLVFNLSPVARIYGKVLNRRSNESYRVVLESKAGAQKTVAADAQTGSFEATGLAPGVWFVRLDRTGGRNDKLRHTIETLTRADGPRREVQLTEGGSVLVNLDASAQQLGSVVGRSLWNGAPAPGLAIRLVAEKRAGTPARANAAIDDRLKKRVLESLLRAESNAQGEFELALVPPGTYSLQVFRGRGRAPRRSTRGRALHRQRVRVSRGVRTRVVVNIETGTVRFQLRDSKTGKPIRGARVSAVLAVEAAGKKPRDWLRLPSFVRASAGSGGAVLRDVPVGEYIYFVSGIGIAVQQGRLFVAAGDGNAVKKLTLERKGTGRPSSRKSRRRRR